jgi:hypothetical protein
MNKILAWIGKGLAGIVGALILFVALVSLVTMSPATGAKAGYSVLHFGLVSTGIVVSYADNVGPDLKQGQAIGNKASGCPAGATKCP